MSAPRQPHPPKAPPRNRDEQISAARKAAFNILLAAERGALASLRSTALTILEAKR
jgi:hypothetical protein